MKATRKPIRSCDCEWDEPEIFYGIGSGESGQSGRPKLRSVSAAAHEAFETARLNRTRIKPGFYR